MTTTTRRKKKPTVVEFAPQEESVELPVPENQPEPTEFVPQELPFGGRLFTIAPIARRGGEGAYDDATEFTILAMPLITRLFNMAMSGHVNLGLTKEETPASVASELMHNVTEQDMLGLVTEMSKRLPRLAAIACEIDEKEAKRLAGHPLNPEMLNIVMTQIMADRLLETVIGLGAGFAFQG